jgi:hypothetical protein
MRVLSKKVLTALRHVRRARPASLIAAPAFFHLIRAPALSPGIAVPLISAPAVLGSQLNPIDVDNLTDDNFITENPHFSQSAIQPLPTPMANADPNSLTNSLRNLCINNPDTGTRIQIVASGSETTSVPTPAHQETHTLIPITEYITENSEENARICLHNLRHIAKYHGFDLKKLHPDVFR